MFIGDMSKDCTEDDLYETFSQYGEVAEVLIKRSKVTKNPLGYGFVRMVQPEAARLCMEHLNGATICGRSIRLNWAQRNTRLQVINIESSVTESDLNKLFGEYGELYEEETVLKRVFGTIFPTSTKS